MIGKKEEKIHKQLKRAVKHLNYHNISLWPGFATAINPLIFQPDKDTKRQKIYRLKQSYYGLRFVRQFSEENNKGEILFSYMSYRADHAELVKKYLHTFSENKIIFWRKERCYSKKQVAFSSGYSFPRLLVHLRSNNKSEM